MTDVLTFTYDRTPEPRRPPVPAGTPVYAVTNAGLLEQVAVIGPPVAIDTEYRQFLLPVPRTWQSEGGDQG